MVQPSGVFVVRLSDMTMMLELPPMDATAETVVVGMTPPPELPANVQLETTVVTAGSP